MICLIYNRKLARTHAIWMTMVKIPRDFIVKGDGGRGRGEKRKLFERASMTTRERRFIFRNSIRAFKYPSNK